jgi:anhydro-N-acetylmuramic acid kinase
VEAATFAWLAKRCLDREPGNLADVTGATREAVLGGVYYAPDFV